MSFPCVSWALIAVMILAVMSNVIVMSDTSIQTPLSQESSKNVLIAVIPEDEDRVARVGLVKRSPGKSASKPATGLDSSTFSAPTMLSSPSFPSSFQRGTSLENLQHVEDDLFPPNPSQQQQRYSNDPRPHDPDIPALPEFPVHADNIVRHATYAEYQDLMLHALLSSLIACPSYLSTWCKFSNDIPR